MGIICAAIMALTLNWRQIGEFVAYSPAGEEVIFDQADLDLMARVVMSESSVEPFDVKQGVAQTIINRLYSKNYPDILEDVIRGQFSTRDNGIPNDECYEAVIHTIMNPEAYPTDMYWFRADHYHSFANPYMHIPGTNTWFSTETDYNTVFLEE